MGRIDEYFITIERGGICGQVANFDYIEKQDLLVTRGYEVGAWNRS